MDVTRHRALARAMAKLQKIALDASNVTSHRHQLASFALLDLWSLVRYYKKHCKNDKEKVHDIKIKICVCLHNHESMTTSMRRRFSLVSSLRNY